MSMRSWSVYGYGFPLFTGENCANIVGFLKRNEHIIKTVYKSDAESILCSLDELEDKIAPDGTVDNEEFIESLYEILGPNPADTIAAILNRKLEVAGFEGSPACGETEAEDTVLYTPLYPWQMMDNDRVLTEDKLKSLVEPYLRELGIDASKFEEMEIEMFG